MNKQGINAFKYYVGVDTMDNLATREDRVCVLNILGGESRLVSPVSHAFSGGNIVFGTSPGKHGYTDTRLTITVCFLMNRIHRPNGRTRRNNCLKHTGTKRKSGRPREFPSWL